MPTPADLQRDVARLTGLAQRDLARLWQHVAGFAAAEEALNDVLPLLTRQYGEAAALLAAEWYDDLRDQHGIPRRFSAIPAALAEQGLDSLAGWARSEAASLDTMQALVAGGLTRRIADWSRETVMGSSFADPSADGWMRSGRANACAFCRLLISRGAVYTESSVKFASHDWCTCGCAPSWGGAADVFDVEEYRRSARRWNADGTKKKSAEADDARARQWIAEHL